MNVYTSIDYGLNHWCNLQLKKRTSYNFCIHEKKDWTRVEDTLAKFLSSMIYILGLSLLYRLYHCAL